MGNNLCCMSRDPNRDKQLAEWKETILCGRKLGERRRQPQEETAKAISHGLARSLSRDELIRAEEEARKQRAAAQGQGQGSPSAFYDSAGPAASSSPPTSSAAASFYATAGPPAHVHKDDSFAAWRKDGPKVNK